MSKIDRLDERDRTWGDAQAHGTASDTVIGGFGAVENSDTLPTKYDADVTFATPAMAEEMAGVLLDHVLNGRLDLPATSDAKAAVTGGPSTVLDRNADATLVAPPKEIPFTGLVCEPGGADTTGALKAQGEVPLPLISPQRGPDADETAAHLKAANFAQVVNNETARREGEERANTLSKVWGIVRYFLIAGGIIGGLALAADGYFEITDKDSWLRTRTRVGQIFNR